MKTTNQTQSWSFLQVFLAGILVILLLRFITGLLWLVFSTVPFYRMGESLQILPLPLLIVLIPALLAFIIIFFAGPKWESDQQDSATNTPEELSEQAENQRLYDPRYTPQQVWNIIKVIVVIWLAILLLQIVLWYAFSRYE